MNIFLFLSFFLFIFQFVVVQGNVPQSKEGVFEGFQSLHRGEGLVRKRQPSATFEKDANSVDSNVFDILSTEDFERLIIKNSYYKPVVLKVYAPKHKDCVQINNTFQEVAQTFGNNVVFAGIDVVKNVKLYSKLNLFCKLQDVELPLFLFCDKGHFKMPFLTGLQHKDYLIGYIQRMFFTAEGAE